MGMHHIFHCSRMSPDSSPLDWTSFATLPRAAKTVLVLDLVESVRLMEQDEAGTVRRWQMVQRMVVGLLDKHHGRLVKSLGDGMMLEFDEPSTAAHCALAVQEAMLQHGLQDAPDRRMHLRTGVHVAQVYTDDLDIYGIGVNLAARLATLAGPDEIVISAAMRDHLADGLDATVEDLGECYLKHVAAPVHAYRLGPASRMELAAFPGVELRPSIAIVPFKARTAMPETWVVGEVLADELIVVLARSAHVHVISRLSTAPFRERALGAAEIGAHLRARYVVSGSYLEQQGSLIVWAELADAHTAEVVWSGRCLGSIADLLAGDSQLVQQIASAVGRHLLQHQLQAATGAPLPTLDGCTLLMGAVASLHRFSRTHFDRAEQMLTHLMERHPREPLPKVWLARWYDLRVVQGWSAPAQPDRLKAMALCQAALDRTPESSLALATAGAVQTNLFKNLEEGERLYKLAIDVNPSESLAWLLLGAKYTFDGRGDAALEACARAIDLSPLDPLAFFYDSLAAGAALAAGRYAEAEERAMRSLRLNLSHASSYRILITAQVMQDRLDEARQASARLMQLAPDFSVGKYRAMSPVTHAGFLAILTDSLRRAGVPQD
jgi:adenylate cyclase